MEEYIYDKWDSEISKSKGAYKPIKYVISENGCWVCISHYVDQDGYAIVNRNGRAVKVHRYVYQSEVRKLSDDEVLLHSCDNPPCCNPCHLIPGTHQDNQHDKFSKGRGAIGENVGSSKLTEGQVRAVFNDTRTLREIGEDYGIAKTTVSCIKRGKSWRHLNLKREAN